MDDLEKEMKDVMGDVEKIADLTSEDVAADAMVYANEIEELGDALESKVLKQIAKNLQEELERIEALVQKLNELAGSVSGSLETVNDSVDWNAS